jgi:ABC-2 type transport system permease protein
VTAGTLAWFARHESRLAWRDWLAMITAGRRRRLRTVVVAFIAFLIFLHLLALSMVGGFAEAANAGDKAALVLITGSVLLSWALMLSQAMETITRAFYARSDLDLILSSPVAAQKVFHVRIVTLAGSLVLMAMLLAAPFINVLALQGGARWLSAYGVVVAMGASAAALAVGLTVALFRTIGPKRTRFVAQVVAAVIGASFVIILQTAAILSHGTLSRFAMLQSDTLVAHAPALDSVVWWPACAILGDPAALAAVIGASLVLLAASAAVFSPWLGEHVVAAASLGNGDTARQRVARPASAFRSASQTRTLRRKEWVLLRRDPWLISQTLMQMLYLLPPAVLLWRGFADGTAGTVLLVPVLVMAAGQLAGGLAWLAISGEDAPDLVATAPVPTVQIVRAKVEAVLGAVALIFVPFIAAMALLSPWQAAACALGIAVAAASSTMIQLWFRSQAKRSHFRRRQTSSRMATFAEAFSSVTWAATAALAAAGTWFAAITGMIAIMILLGTRVLSPRP